MGTNTDFLKRIGLDQYGDWITSNKEELINSINETEDKLTEEINKKKEEREVLRLMRDMINTTST